MKEFKVLPTDERFQALFPEQKVFIYEAYNYLPDNEMLKNVGTLLNQKEELKKKTYKQLIPASVIKNMRRAYKIQGLSRAETEKILEKQADTARGAQMKDIDKKLSAILGIRDYTSASREVPDDVLKRRGEAINKHYGRQEK